MPIFTPLFDQEGSSVTFSNFHHIFIYILRWYDENMVLLLAFPMVLWFFLWLRIKSSFRHKVMVIFPWKICLIQYNMQFLWNFITSSCTSQDDIMKIWCCYWPSQWFSDFFSGCWLIVVSVTGVMVIFPWKVSLIRYNMQLHYYCNSQIRWLNFE